MVYEIDEKNPSYIDDENSTVHIKFDMNEKKESKDNK